MIYVTGDIHGEVDGRFDGARLAARGIVPAEGDLLVILGDTGILWQTSPEEWGDGDMDATDSWLVRDLLDAWPGEVAFIDGNHDNHPTLAALRREERWGGEVGVVVDGLYHLRRGEVYDLPNGDGTTSRAWCMGGAWSIDKEVRVEEGLGWWPEEIPSEEELDRGRESLDAAGWEVDYVLTHECPPDMQDALTTDSPFGPVEHEDDLQDLLADVDDHATFDRWYCGHYHTNLDYGSCHTCLYDAIVPLGADSRGNCDQ
ncbi:MAG: hypothetical protein LKE37_05325 [Atopobiaceae bacterium]|nr:hypothetical protein [Atopobiaceae bacterium]